MPFLHWPQDGDVPYRNTANLLGSLITKYIFFKENIQNIQIDSSETYINKYKIRRVV